jgi:hypothetical protein
MPDHEQLVIVQDDPPASDNKFFGLGHMIMFQFPYYFTSNLSQNP